MTRLAPKRQMGNKVTPPGMQPTIHDRTDGRERRGAR